MVSLGMKPSKSKAMGEAIGSGIGCTILVGSGLQLVRQNSILGWGCLAMSYRYCTQIPAHIENAASSQVDGNLEDISKGIKQTLL